MKSPEQHRIRILGTSIRLSAFAPALAIAFVLAVFATPVAQAQTFSVIHNFQGPDGSQPWGDSTMDAAGNLYGTTYYGGAFGYGIAFKLTHKGSGWSLNPLYSFQGGHDGDSPRAGVTIGSDGNLYGTTVYGGNCCGTVFKLSPPASACKTALCAWTETVLYRFSGGEDGSNPYGPVLFDKAGNLYGTTYSGGAGNRGVVFKLTPSLSGWREVLLHSFGDSPDGAYPISGLAFDRAGNLYGTTQYGGSVNAGTVFQLTPSESGWTENILYSFQDNSDGAVPYGALIFDNLGDLYGTTSFGGNGAGGTAFELTPSGGNWIFTLLHSFVGTLAAGPTSTLAMHTSGNLYGTSFSNGIDTCSGYGCGCVFKLVRSDNGWTYTDLHDFTGGSDSGNPYAGVIVGANGNVYGTTTFGSGNVFEITP